MFFLSVSANNFEPVGFMKTPSAVTNMEWSPGHHVSTLINLWLASGINLLPALIRKATCNNMHLREQA